MSLRITTWNVNGIRNPFGYHPWSSQKSFQHMFDVLEADIVCFQETKIQRKDLTDDMVMVPGWDSYFTFPKYKKGYSGVAVYTRNSKCHPIKAEEGITGILESADHSKKPYRLLPSSECIGGYPDLTDEEALLLDSEGRALLLDFGAFVLIGVYCPASTDSARDPFRIAFVEALFNRARNLITNLKREVIIVGDLNIARDEIDAAGARDIMQEMGIQHWKDTPTRRSLDLLLEPRCTAPMVDLCRDFFPRRTGMYTCWDMKKNKRPGNAGSRIDYILCSSTMKSWFMEANIQEGLMGSDHCPVFATLKPTVDYNGCEHSILDIINPVGIYLNGERQPSAPDPQPPRLCMKRSSEFAQRQNIKELFNKIKSNTTVHSVEKSHHEKPSTPIEPPSKKLKSSSSPSTVQSLKRKKSNTQTTLHTFFQRPSNSRSSKSEENMPHQNYQQSQVRPVHHISQIGGPESGSQPTSIDNKNDDDCINTLKSKEKWAMLFTKKKPPVCNKHGDECIQLTTKKPGPNHGRAFWMCSRPIGPEGESTMKTIRNTEWKCDYFKWASDWDGNK